MRTETAKLLPASLGRWRTDKKYSPYKDIRKNLFQKYDNNVYSPDDTPTLVCIFCISIFNLHIGAYTLTHTHTVTCIVV